MNQKRTILFGIFGFFLMLLLISLAFYIGFLQGQSLKEPVVNTTLPTIQTIPGEINITFKENVDPEIAKVEFRQINLSLPDNVLRSNHTYLITPHRGQVDKYLKIFSQDSMILNIDYSLTDKSLLALNEKIENDADYLWITFTKPLSKNEELSWLLSNHPELKDIYLQLNQTETSIAVVNNSTGQESYGGYINPWNNNIVISVSAGKENEYLSQIQNLSTVKSAALIPQLNTPPPSQ